MEIRDVIPSQSQIAIQRNVEAETTKFKELMHQKFSSISQKREDHVKIRNNRTENKCACSSEAKAPKTEIAADTTSNEPKLNESKRAVEVKEDGLAESDSMTAVEEDVELQESNEPIVVGAEMTEVPALKGNPNEVQAPESEYVDVPPPGETDGSIVRMHRSAATEVSLAETIRVRDAQLKMMYEPHAGTETKQEMDSVKLLEMLGGQKTAEIKAVEGAVIASKELEPENLQIKEIKLGSGVDTEMEHTAAVRHQTEQMTEDVETVKLTSWKEASADTDESEKTGKEMFRIHEMPQKAEAVRHHDNMVANVSRTIIKQVTDAVSADIKVLPSGQAVEVRLNPEHLGKVLMKIEMVEGQMVAKIKVDNTEVKTALEASIQELRESLSQKGVSIKEIQVSVSKDDHRGGQEYTGSNRKRDKDEEETKEFSLNPEGE